MKDISVKVLLFVRQCSKTIILRFVDRNLQIWITILVCFHVYIFLIGYFINYKYSLFKKLFGFALLIASAIYLKRLDSWAEWIPCLSDYADVTEAHNLKDKILCSNFNTWRAAAIIGIIIVIKSIAFFSIHLSSLILGCGRCSLSATPYVLYNLRCLWLHCTSLCMC